MDESKMMGAMRASMRDFCRDVMNNIPDVFGRLMSDSEKLGKYSSGLNEMAATVESGSDENVRKQLRNTMVVVRDLCISQQRLFMLMAVYIASGTAEKDAGMASIKFGASGEDILKDMMQRKMRGN